MPPTTPAPTPHAVGAALAPVRQMKPPPLKLRCTSPRLRPQQPDTGARRHGHQGLPAVTLLPGAPRTGAECGQHTTRVEADAMPEALAERRWHQGSRRYRSGRPELSAAGTMPMNGRSRLGTGSHLHPLPSRALDNWRATPLLPASKPCLQRTSTSRRSAKHCECQRPPPPSLARKPPNWELPEPPLP